ncbi:hypothetical protein [Pseudomonas aeruginosa]|uniref:hypothetical protein n=1 Tax=Pseudomonas aeruginosa TaxID=287 RepID=UPI0023799125|nr:hypothetical protein [Pseudomonas aeruginosa]WDM05462.1 hypothetical protein LEL82_28900 [Pseudomonas aeruginosa]
MMHLLQSSNRVALSFCNRPSLLIILKAEGLVKGGNSAYEPLKESGSFLEKIKTIREMFATSQDENIAEIRLAIDMLKAQDAEKNSKA